MKPGSIPSILHIIGFGEDYVLGYKNNLEKWKKHWKGAQINLWFMSAKDKLAEDELKEIKKLCDEIGINLIDIKTSTKLTLHLDIIEQIKAENYWAAADIAKFSILKDYPGTVCDIDTRPIDNLPNDNLPNFPDAPCGFFAYICDLDDKPNSVDPVRLMAAIISVAYSEHPIVRATLQVIEENLIFMKENSLLKKYLSRDTSTNKLYTVAVHATGTPLCHLLRKVNLTTSLQKLSYPENFKVFFDTDKSNEESQMKTIWHVTWYSQTYKAAANAWEKWGKTTPKAPTKNNLTPGEKLDGAQHDNRDSEVQQTKESSSFFHIEKSDIEVQPSSPPHSSPTH
jgi:hypothetical protein